MEKTNQKEVEYMNKPWIDTRLSQECMRYLWACISEENKENNSKNLAGNISKSELLNDKDNWFYETVLKKPTERLFYDDWNNYRKYAVGKNEDEKPKFEMSPLWVNYQKQHEFNPLHSHDGLYSFVVFMKIPTHWKEQHALPISAKSNSPQASDFLFVRSEKNSEICIVDNFPLNSEDEGRMLFFPAWLSHMVYPFYGTEEERITISGNIDFYDPNRPKMQGGSGDVYEQKENMLEMMEIGVESVKKELKEMKKAREKEE